MPNCSINEIELELSIRELYKIASTLPESPVVIEFKTEEGREAFLNGLEKRLKVTNNVRTSRNTSKKKRRSR